MNELGKATLVVDHSAVGVDALLSAERSSVDECEHQQVDMGDNQDRDDDEDPPREDHGGGAVSESTRGSRTKSVTDQRWIERGRPRAILELGIGLYWGIGYWVVLGYWGIGLEK